MSPVRRNGSRTDEPCRIVATPFHGWVAGARGVRRERPTGAVDVPTRPMAATTPNFVRPAPMRSSRSASSATPSRSLPWIDIACRKAATPLRFFPTDSISIRRKADHTPAVLSGGFDIDSPQGRRHCASRRIRYRFAVTDRRAVGRGTGRAWGRAGAGSGGGRGGGAGGSEGAKGGGGRGAAGLGRARLGSEARRQTCARRGRRRRLDRSLGWSIEGDGGPRGRCGAPIRRVGSSARRGLRLTLRSSAPVRSHAHGVSLRVRCRRARGPPRGRLPRRRRHRRRRVPRRPAAEAGARRGSGRRRQDRAGEVGRRDRPAPASSACSATRASTSRRRSTSGTTRSSCCASRPTASTSDDWETVEADIFSEEFLLTRPLLEAIRADEPVVLLIDEVDRVEIETEALLLEMLSDFQVSIPELGTIEAKQIPLVFLTSNNTRELSEALKRRCLFLHIDYPDARAREGDRARARCPTSPTNLADQIARIVRSIRQLELKKAPSISETIDWARTLVLLGIEHIDARGGQGRRSTSCSSTRPTSPRRQGARQRAAALRTRRCQGKLTVTDRDSVAPATMLDLLRASSRSCARRACRSA